MNPLDLIKGLMGNHDGKRKVALAAVSEEDRKMFLEVEALTEKIKQLVAEKDAKKNLFWARVETGLGRYGLNLSYEKETGMVYQIVDDHSKGKDIEVCGGCPDMDNCNGEE